MAAAGASRSSDSPGEQEKRRGDGGDWFGVGVPLAVILAVLLYAATWADGGFSLGPGDVSAQLGDLLWFSLICGLASFATIEVLKRVFLLRGLYQRRQTRNWLRERGADAEAAFRELTDAMGLGRRVEKQAAESPEGKDGEDWVVNVSSQEGLRVFNLPTEQLAAQVSAAAEVALSSPQRYFLLIWGLTGAPPRYQERPSYDPEARRDDTEESERDYALAQRVRAGVDQLQISLGERWRRYVQTSALALAGLYGIALTEASEFEHPDEALYVAAAVLIGGMFAWVARDVAATLERSRR